MFDARQSSGGSSRSGFSLIELLVSITVLAIMVLIIAQMVTGTADTTKLSRKRIDADNEVRRIFDRMALDFDGMLDRSDVDFLVRKLAGNDEFYFFSEAPGRSGGGVVTQPVSLVGYRLNTQQQIERLGWGLQWDAAPPEGPVFLTFSSGVPLAATTLEGAYSTVLTDDQNYSTLGEGVFRMELDFVLKPENGQPAKFSSSPFRSGGSSPFGNSGKGLSDVYGIVVTLVVLDKDSRKIVSSGDLSGLVSKFADTTEGATPSGEWHNVVDNPSSLGIPPAAAAQIRIYQRTFSLNKRISNSL